MREFGIAVVIAVLVAVVTLAVVEIGSGEDDGGLVAFDSSRSGDASLPNGAELFVSAGCAACHGAGGGGGIGPALPGHTAEQVIRQARRPLNAMPLFTSDELSDEELEQIAAFVTNLPMEDAMHMAHDEASEGQLDPRDETAMHHWMALSALRAGNASAAAAHVGAVVDAVSGEHEAAMVEALDAINANQLGTAESLVIGMLAGFEPDVSDEQILVRLALQALVVKDQVEAIKDLEAALELADASTASQIQSGIAAIARGETSEAEELLSPLTGLPEHDGAEDHNPGADDEDAEDHEASGEDHDEDAEDHDE